MGMAAHKLTRDIGFSRLPFSHVDYSKPLALIQRQRFPYHGFDAEFSLAQSPSLGSHASP